MAIATFYPSLDGYVYHTQAAGAWSDLVNGVGSGYFDGGSAGNVLGFLGSDPGKWERLHRAIYLFDTSSLPDDAEISAAVLSIHGVSKYSDCNPTVCIYSSNPASDNVLIAGDFDSLGSTPFSGTISHTAWSTIGYNDFTLNVAGRAAISKTGISKFGTRCANYDVANIEPITALTSNWVSGYFIESGYKPKLVVTYTTPPYVIKPSSITSSEAFGTAKKILYLKPSSIASAQAFGLLKVRGPVRPPSIASTETFGAIKVLREGDIKPFAIASLEAFGTAIVAGPVRASGIASAEAFGTAKVFTLLRISSVISAEAFGTAKLNQFVSLTGIASLEAFGSPLSVFKGRKLQVKVITSGG